jgi:hypothetical protein
MAQIRWARGPWPPGGCVQNFPRIKDFGRLKCSKKPGFLSKHVARRCEQEQGVREGEWGQGSREGVVDAPRTTALGLGGVLPPPSFFLAIHSVLFVSFSALACL